MGRRAAPGEVNENWTSAVGWKTYWRKSQWIRLTVIFKVPCICAVSIFLIFPQHLFSGEMETRTFTFPLLLRAVRSQDFSFTELSWVMVPFADMGSQKEGKVLRGKKTSLVLDVIMFIIQF